MSNISAYFGETMKSGSGVVATADYSGTTSVAGLYGPTGVGGFASGQFQFVSIGPFSGSGSSSASLAGATINATVGAGGLKVLGNKPQLGDPCQLFDIGEVKVVAGGSLAVGAIVMSDTDGRAVTYINNGQNVPVGECRVPANSANDICTIFMYPNMDEGDAPPPTFPAATGIVAHAGGTKAAAFQLGYGFSNVTTIATGGDSLLLPAAVPGTFCVVANESDTTNAGDIYGQGTDTIDAVATATAFSLAENATVLFACVATGLWISLKGVNVAAT
jgi:hypothetical protein